MRRFDQGIQRTGWCNESLYIAILSIVLVSALGICDERVLFIGVIRLGFLSRLRKMVHSIPISLQSIKRVADIRGMTGIQRYLKLKILTNPGQTC
jgi:hypothetical protein